VHAWIQLPVVAVVLFNFFVLGSSRMRALIRVTALQGAILGLMPLLIHQGISVRLIFVCALTVGLKAGFIPYLLHRAMREVNIRREVEPLLGYVPSLLLGAVGTGLAGWFADTLPLLEPHTGLLIVPAGFSTMFTGFIILTTRLKAITQVIGYLILENGIFMFGLLLIEALPALVELGVLLDLFVGVFVMGIILNHIQRTFSSLDTTHLSTLKD
jgi:hydrogenase-4 component E